MVHIDLRASRIFLYIPRPLGINRNNK